MPKGPHLVPRDRVGSSAQSLARLTRAPRGNGPVPKRDQSPDRRVAPDRLPRMSQVRFPGSMRRWIKLMGHRCGRPFTSDGRSSEAAAWKHPTTETNGGGSNADSVNTGSRSFRHGVRTTELVPVQDLSSTGESDSSTTGASPSLQSTSDQDERRRWLPRSCDQR